MPLWIGPERQWRGWMLRCFTVKLFRMNKRLLVINEEILYLIYTCVDYNIVVGG